MLVDSEDRGRDLKDVQDLLKRLETVTEYMAGLEKRITEHKAVSKVCDFTFANPRAPVGTVPTQVWAYFWYTLLFYKWRRVLLGFLFRNFYFFYRLFCLGRFHLEISVMCKNRCRFFSAISGPGKVPYHAGIFSYFIKIYVNMYSGLQ